MSFKMAVELLNEFNYERNGREETIKFLVYVLNGLVNGGDNND